MCVFPLIFSLISSPLASSTLGSHHHYWYDPCRPRARRRKLFSLPPFCVLLRKMLAALFLCVRADNGRYCEMMMAGQADGRTCEVKWPLRAPKSALFRRSRWQHGEREALCYLCRLLGGCWWTRATPNSVSEKRRPTADIVWPPDQEWTSAPPNSAHWFLILLVGV